MTWIQFVLAGTNLDVPIAKNPPSWVFFFPVYGDPNGSVVVLDPSKLAIQPPNSTYRRHVSYLSITKGIYDTLFDAKADLF